MDCDGGIVGNVGSSAMRGDLNSNPLLLLFIQSVSHDFMFSVMRSHCGGL